MNSKERCLAVLQGKEADRIPVFPLMMFFAADRIGVPYKRYVTESDVIVEAQLNLHENYCLDVVTVCSDAFRVSADAGAQMQFPENQTPFAVQPLIKTRSDLKAVKRPDPNKPGGRMRNRIDAVGKLAKNVGEEALVMGWVEMPFAESCDWCGLSNFMTMLYDDPELAHELLDYVTEIEIEFALAQLEAGAHIIGCGDAAASLISAPAFREFALHYEQRVTDAIKKAGGMSKLHICGNTMHILEDMATNGSDLYNIDHMVDFIEASRVYNAAGKAFKGNVDPVADLLQATPEEAEAAALSCINAAKGMRYMLSAGCEIPAATPNEVYFAFAGAVMK